MALKSKWDFMVSGELLSFFYETICKQLLVFQRIFELKLSCVMSCWLFCIGDHSGSPVIWAVSCFNLLLIRQAIKNICLKLLSVFVVKIFNSFPQHVHFGLCLFVVQLTARISCSGLKYNRRSLPTQPVTGRTTRQKASAMAAAAAASSSSSSSLQEGTSTGIKRSDSSKGKSLAKRFKKNPLSEQITTATLTKVCKQQEF